MTSTHSRRLPQGGLIDRSKLLGFKFDGASYEGYEGDTLASALLANGVSLVGRSFKYHRPRGILTAGPEEPNALVTIGAGANAAPNTLATTTWLTAGLEAHSQNRWPSLRFDAMSATSLLSPFFAAGFYYKTFMWPAALWEKLYEPVIRRAAGLGALSGEADPSEYDRQHVFCDLLVIGAGPAGLAAALMGARSGLRVLLVEQDAQLGGRLLSEDHAIDGRAASLWVNVAKDELAAAANVTVLTRTSVFGAYDGGAYAALETCAAGPARQRYWKIVAKHAVLAAGAIERPLIFAGNDAPGVMMASAVQSYAHRFAVAPGKRIAVFTSADSGWAAAADMCAAGANIAALIEARPSVDASLMRRARALGIEFHLQTRVVTAHGGASLRSVDLQDASGATRRLETDCLAMAGGWSPAMGLGCNTGRRPVWSDALDTFVLRDPPAGMSLAGAANGSLTLSGALSEGFAAAANVARALGRTPADIVVPPTDDELAAVAPFSRAKGKHGKAFVDFQNDVTVSDIALAVQEGFTSVEHLKRYTTLGMATDQGKTSNVNGHALLAEFTGAAPAQAGTILSRPPFTPVPIGAIAGPHRDEHFRPSRLTPSHDWAVENGAIFVDAGAWRRAQWFPKAGERDWLESVNREVTAVRTGVGVCDVSTLGKIDIQGPDAAALLDRVYANTFSTLPIGRARYGLMLREDGFVFDDGTTARLAEDHFFMTTTTANAARVMQHLDFCRQALWPELDVQAVSVTEQWAQYAIAGPRARALLERVLPDVDLSNTAFPYMAAMKLTWRGLPARLYRLSFSGELAYEFAVPSQYGDALIRLLMESGADLGVTPYGTEALSVMRIEKGHVAGNELNGQTTARDLGLGRMLAPRKDFIGRAMARRAALTEAARPTLVGVKPVERGARLRAGAHILPSTTPAHIEDDLGWVSSVAFSPTLGHWIGLALVKNGPARLGERLRAYDPVRGGDIAVELCAPVFVDPEGVRLRG
jgi:methylglutamate dehydrogenase subunit C